MPTGARLVLALVVLVAGTPLVTAETVNVGNGVLVIGANEDPGAGLPGARVHVASAPAGAKYDWRAGCHVNPYVTSCGVTDTGSPGAPMRLVDATTRYSSPETCAELAVRPDPKQGTIASACGPGRVYPLPWGRCVHAELDVLGALVTRSERCLVP